MKSIRTVFESFPFIHPSKMYILYINVGTQMHMFVNCLSLADITTGRLVNIAV